MPGRTAVTEAGFTLTEMLVAVTVFSLLIVIVAPRLNTSLRGAQGRSAAAQFASAHFMARTAAMRYGRPAELHIDATNARFWVEADTLVAGGARDTIGVVHGLSGRLTMASTRSVVCFDRRGLAWTGGSCQPGDATVIFSGVGRSDTVTTTILGKLVR